MTDILNSWAFRIFCLGVFIGVLITIWGDLHWMVVERAKQILRRAKAREAAKQAYKAKLKETNI